MRIGLFTSGYQRNPLEHAFEDAKRFGYDFIELWGGRPHAFAPDLKKGELDSVLNLIETYNIPVEIYTPEHNGYPYNFMAGTELQRLDAIEYLKTAMEMSKAMGASYTLISPGHAGYLTSHEVIWSRLKKTLETLTSFAEKIDHRIILEALTPYESNVCTSANDLAHALKLVPSERLVGMCDLVPPFVLNESILGYFDKLGSKMAHLHIVDSDGRSDTHVLPGEGVLPLKELLGELKAMNYKGTATIELVTAYMNEPRLYANRAITNLKSLLK